MNKLNKYAFSDLYDIASGISTTKTQAGHGTPFVSFSTVFNNIFLPDELPDLMDTSEQEQETYSIRKGDILITRTSETADELAMSCVALKDYPGATYSGFVKRLRPKTIGVAYDKFMAFFLRSKYFRKVINNNTIMTLRASFNEDMFSFLTLYLPDYDVQVAVGDLLYNIECKIQNNKRINDNLQQQLRLLYDYWFMQFDFPDENGKPYRSSGGQMVWNDDLKRHIPKAWGCDNLYRIADYINGLACQKYRPVNGEKALPVIKIKEMHDGITADTELVSANIPSKNIVQSGDILFSWSASLEIAFWFGRTAGLNQHIFKVIPKAPFSCEYVYLQLSEYIVQFVRIAESRKTTMGHITSDHLNESRIVVPSSAVIQKFSTIVRPIFEELKVCHAEMEHLQSLRDWLLPMLMNGQATISD